MNLYKFNETLRDLFNGLISDGFSRNDISSITFGNNRQDQMKEFLRGRRISGKPLINMFNDLGFEVHLVPVNKSNVKATEIVNELASDAFDALQISFVNYLENKEEEKRRKKNIVFFVDYIVEKINKGKVNNLNASFSDSGPKLEQCTTVHQAKSWSPTKSHRNE